jgi:signal transduction histidine kinase
MSASPEGRPHQLAGQPLAWLAAGLLAGCSEIQPTAGLWGFLSLALAGSALGGYALGAARHRRRHEHDLRQAREQLREQRQLQRACSWQTDLTHRLVAWQRPDGAPELPHPLLARALEEQFSARLRAEQPFAAVPLHAAQAVQGSRTWELCGVPRHDDLGRFRGFVGQARPTDEAYAAAADAVALRAALDACSEPMLVAADTGPGWQVRHFNAAAAALWPALTDGATPALADGPWPSALAHAMDDSASAPVEGWHWVWLDPVPGFGRGLLLWHRPLAAAPAAAPAADAARESDAFSFTVSHDLRAPIRVVEGFTRIVKEDYGRVLDRVGNDHLDRVLGAAARMNLMIDALLTLARLSSQPLARQPVNLSQLATFVVDDLRRGAPEREADIDIEDGLITHGDPTLLRLVLENLLGNAWKYSARTTRAQISLRRVPHDGQPAFAVRDNGAGFDMRSADRLFGLFQRLHSASEFPGHGVGLASVRRIVQRHGGSVWAEAEPGRGAAFYFTLAG